MRRILLHVGAIFLALIIFPLPFHAFDTIVRSMHLNDYACLDTKACIFSLEKIAAERREAFLRWLCLVGLLSAFCMALALLFIRLRRRYPLIGWTAIYLFSIYIPLTFLLMTQVLIEMTS